MIGFAPTAFLHKCDNLIADRGSQRDFVLIKLLEREMIGMHEKLGVVHRGLSES